MHRPPAAALAQPAAPQTGHPAAQVPRVTHRTVDVGGVQVFYREAGPSDAPTLLLLHGFPSASHQFRRLIDALGLRYHLVAPDYPGFGHTQAPSSFVYSFETLADVVDGFCSALGLDRYVLYLFDFGGPVGFRLALRHPGRVAGLVVQNANAYEAGLAPAARQVTSLRPDDDGAAEQIRSLLTFEVTRFQYVDGAGEVDQVPPDGPVLDQHFLELPGRTEAQVALGLDYHVNVASYPAWQEWLRQERPPTLVLWGAGDPFFTVAGAEAYLADLPEAELHVLDAGHFALEEKLPEIAPLVAGFTDRVWGRAARRSPAAPRRAR